MDITPYLIFDGTAEAAFTFYHGILGGELPPMARYGDMPGSDAMSDADKKRIMHTRLNLGTSTLMASDAGPGMGYDGIHGVSLAISFDDLDEAQRVFDALSAGGKVTMPLQETFWAKRFGMFVDKFGAEWMINGGPTN